MKIERTDHMSFFRKAGQSAPIDLLDSSIRLSGDAEVSVCKHLAGVSGSSFNSYVNVQPIPLDSQLGEVVQNFISHYKVMEQASMSLNDLLAVIRPLRGAHSGGFAQAAAQKRDIEKPLSEGASDPKDAKSSGGVPQNQQRQVIELICDSFGRFADQRASSYARLSSVCSDLQKISSRLSINDDSSVSKLEEFVNNIDRQISAEEKPEKS